MYPDWPESPADLVPLPTTCPGPRLAAFDFQGPQEIEFLDYLGQGLHAHVVKVRIKGQEYALKLFLFLYEDDWDFPGQHGHNSGRHQQSALGQYSEPFYSECRAFGRLHETGNQHLATPCYGYILLDEEHERKLVEKHDLKFNGFANDPCDDDLRGRFLGKRTGRPPPIRGILKALGSPYNFENPPNTSVVTARRMLRDIIQLQNLGIFRLDTRLGQLIDDKVCDFSTSITTPHFVTTPELNPQLKNDPLSLAILQEETFIYSINDYWNFEDMLVQMCEEDNQKANLKEKVQTFSGLWWQDEDEEKQYDLRQLPHRVEQKKQTYTYVDPRQYDWKSTADTAITTQKANVAPSATKRRQSQRNKNCGGVERKRTLKKPRRVSAKPCGWYLDNASMSPLLSRLVRTRGIYAMSAWRVDDGGNIFPKRNWLRN